MDIKDSLIDLISMDTQNGGSFSGATLDAVKKVKRDLDKVSGVRTILIKYSLSGLGDRGVLIALPKKLGDRKNVMMQGHIDTVPKTGKEKNRMKVENGVIFGRGAVDMKGSLSVFIQVFKEIVRNENRKFNPILLITSDEEANGFMGVKKFLNYKRNFDIDFAICGEPSNMIIYNRFKGVFSGYVEFFGKSAHGARPHLGVNAIYPCAKLVTLLEKFHGFINKKLKNSVFKSSLDYSHKSTLNVGRIEGGKVSNVVPDYCKVTVDMRIVYPRKRYLDLLKKKVFSKLDFKNYKLSESFSFDPVVVSSSGDFIKSLRGSLGKFVKDEIGVMTGFSEATFLNKAGIPTVVFGVGNPKYSHSEDEQIQIKDLETYKKVLIDYFAG